MAELQRLTLARQLGMMVNPFAASWRVTIGLADPSCQALVSCIGDEHRLTETARAILGFDLPHEPNYVAGNTTYALWLAPSQWLVVSDAAKAEVLPRELATTLAGAGGHVSDVTDGLAVFEIIGAAARELLSMGCALDLDGQSMAQGRCARTDFAGMRTILYARDAADHYRLHVDRPLARHMADWFSEAVTAFS